MAMPDGNDCFSYWLGANGDDFFSVFPWTNIVMDRSHTIYGYFGPCDSVYLDVRVVGHGTVDPGVGRLTCQRNASVTLAAQPADGWRFDHWEGDVVSGSNPSVSVTMNASHTATAVFVELPIEQGDPVTFEDSNLEASVRAVIGKSTGPLYRVDLIVPQLRALGTDHLDILSLEGLQYCTPLQYLWLDRDSTTGSREPLDLTPLAGLPNLVFLSLENTPVVSLAPLAGLSTLRRLFLGNCGISDAPPLHDSSALSPLAGLTGLELLGLDNNDIHHIDALSGLTQLEVFSVGNDPLADISAVAGMSSLRHFGGCTVIDDLSPMIDNISIGGAPCWARRRCASRSPFCKAGTQAWRGSVMAVYAATT
jgi:hypothetical protein